MRDTTADDLVALIDNETTFFHSADRVAYATVNIAGHRETSPIRSQAFRWWMLRRYYEEYEETPSSAAVNAALGVLEGEAFCEGKERRVFMRLGEHRGSFYLDLGNARWEAVEIDSRGWHITPNPSVRFYRPRGMASLPSPIRGGSLDELRQFVNVSGRDDWILLVAWLLGALCPHGPFPVLTLHGEQGSAKSTTARILSGRFHKYDDE